QWRRAVSRTRYSHGVVATWQIWSNLREEQFHCEFSFDSSGAGSIAGDVAIAASPKSSHEGLMITGEIKNQIDRIWDAFWSGGIANPLEVIEQITYLLFIRRLDDLHTLEENKANRLKKPIARRVFPEGKDSRDRAYEDFRWSRFKNFEAKEMFTVVGEHVFPFLR